MRGGRSSSLFVSLAISFSLAMYPSLAKPIGKANCGKIDAEDPSATEIERATLESRKGGYKLKLARNGETDVLDLDRRLLVIAARTEGKGSWNLVSYRSAPQPVKIDPQGKFSITMMVSTRSVCEFDGNLTFKDDTRTQLFGWSRFPQPNHLKSP